ncbi:MAG: HAMP domain-containing histidine kinase [Muribaculum sp.]|nr:HAMP domain-containing histidine kinase [Muribaculum sp.]
MTNIYEIRRYGTIFFLIAALGVATVFLSVSSALVKDLANQERSRMQLWADATQAIISAADDIDNDNEAFIDFLLKIIAENRNIPVILTDNDGNIITHRNFDLPEPVDSLNPLAISEGNMIFLQKKLDRLKSRKSNTIPIELAPGVVQTLYYEDSLLLRKLNYYPYIQTGVMIVFIIVVYFAVISTKKAEQNKVWVGLSKETAHQLGTPISSLMAWVQLLEAQGVDSDTVSEMNKDVERLSTIASRFGKIGSRPKMEQADVNTIVASAVDYMKTRISRRISLEFHPGAGQLHVMMSDSLFQWVMENLIKNAVDAMESTGSINVVTGSDQNMAYIEVTDTGKGLPRNRFKTIFNPGYTTKKRGWGLGLALAKRIIEQYHGGKIYVKWSEPGQGTTFRIELPAIAQS